MKIKKAFGISLLALTAFLGACGAKSDEQPKNDNTTDTGTNPGDNTGNNPGTNPGENPGNNPGENPEPETPVIPPKVEGDIAISRSAGDLEAAYAEWENVNGATGYNVYCKKSSLDASNYKKIDSELVRAYNSKMRADVVGLEAGSYDLKIIACDANGETQTKAEVTNITVKAHDRSGYAFDQASAIKTGSGAYNDNGTLKSNAKVFYVTKNSAGKLTMDVVTSSNGSTTACTGIGDILAKREKELDLTPIAIRIVGNVTADDMAGQLLGEKGTLQIKGKANAAQNITIEGIGEDATCNGWGILLNKIGNVEVRNLAVMLFQDDGISLKTCHNTWVHNVDFFYGGKGSDADQAKGDGSMDVKDKSTYITFSYNHFWDSGKSSLCGMKSETTDCKLSYHHNWFDHSDSRHPRVRTSTVHVYNNYFDGVSKYGIGATSGCSIFSEANYFRSTSNMAPMMSSQQGTDALGDGTFSGEPGGMIKSYNDKFDGAAIRFISQNDSSSFDAYVASTRTEAVPDTYKTLVGGTSYSNFDTASTMYTYTAQTPDQAKASVMQYAGRIDGGNFKIEFTDGDDSDYNVNTTIKSALGAYNGTPVTIKTNTPLSPATPNNPVEEDTTEWTTTKNANFSEYNITRTEEIPTTNGLFYRIVDNATGTTIGTTDPTKNNISVNDAGVLSINDLSDDTTEGYYMFDALTGSKTKITINLSGLASKGKWSVITLYTTNNEAITFRTNDKKILSYSLDGGTTLLGASKELSANTSISITVDSTTNKTILEYGGATNELDGLYNAKGIKFNTAGTDLRSFACSGIVFKTLA